MIIRGTTNVVVLLLVIQFQLLLVTESVTAGCQEICGNVSIPYPFGIGEGCFRGEGYQIHCNESIDGTYKPYYGNIEVINISVDTSQARVKKHIAFACYNSSGFQTSSKHSPIDLTDSPCTLSNTANRFTVIGCRSLAYIIGPLKEEAANYMSGCLSMCQNQTVAADGEPCSGMGCCQTPIPKGLQYYRVRFDSGFNHSYVYDFSPCSFAFLAEYDSYKFKTHQVYFDEVYFQNKKRFPVVLDWAISKGGVNETCEQAKQNMTDYACVSPNSACFNSANAPGYTCKCTSGYQGNPYIRSGLNSCLDIDECKTPEKYSCYGNCENKEGYFECTCPVGTNGNPNIQLGCQPRPSKISLPGKILIACLCIFLVSAVMYLVYEKAKLSRAKQKCFRQNGGLLLQEQINAHECVRFKLFSIEEIERATDKFHENQVRGRGGQGIVYEGILNDKRRVAVKKSIMIDENKKKDFAKEMYILSLINHKNVIKILGCCLEVEVPILVYEFISSGTLYQYIQNRNRSMSLGFRLKLAVDSASAFAYLHSDASPPIVHGDVKSMNILLDDECMAKISDFGGSLLPSKEINEAGIPGTRGYLDPESLMTGQLTEKSDIYSFAVVILELLTRKKAVYTKENGELETLVHVFKEEGLAAIIDDEIKYVVTEEQVNELSELLRMCLQESGEERPKMTEVVARLCRMRELNQNLLEEYRLGDVEIVTEESNYRTTYTALYNSSGHHAVFELDYNLTR